MSTPTRITHLVAGAPWEGTAERTGPVYNPATGEQSGAVDFASAALVGEVVAAAKHAWENEWGNVSLAKRDPGPLQVPPAARRAQGRDRGAHHRRARQGPLRRPGRGHPRPGGRGVRLRHPAPAQGRVHRERLDRRRRVLDPPAARRRRGHLAVQLPRDGPAVVHPRRHRRRQRRRPQAEREGPERGRRHRQAVDRGRAAGRRHERRPRRQGGRRRPAHPPRRQGRCPSSARPRSPSTSTRPAPRNGKRVQALGGAKNHMLVLPDADLDLAADAAVNAGFGSAGERCMAISVLRGRRPDRRRARREDHRPDGQARHRRRHPRLRHGPAGHPAAPRQGRVLPRRRGPRLARLWSSTVVASRSTARTAGYFLGADACSTTSRPR